MNRVKKKTSPEILREMFDIEPKNEKEAYARNKEIALQFLEENGVKEVRVHFIVLDKSESSEYYSSIPGFESSEYYSSIPGLGVSSVSFLDRHHKTLPCGTNGLDFYEYLEGDGRSAGIWDHEQKGFEQAWFWFICFAEYFYLKMGLPNAESVCVFDAGSFQVTLELFPESEIA